MPDNPEPTVTVRFTENREVRDHEDRVVAKHRVGEVKEFSRSSAVHWLSRGVAEIVGGAPEPEPAEDEDPRPEGDALLAAIAAAIDGLDPKTDYTREGVPKVEALESELGYGISAAERDAAWDSVSGGPA